MSGPPKITAIYFGSKYFEIISAISFDELTEISDGFSMAVLPAAILYSNGLIMRFIG